MHIEWIYHRNVPSLGDGEHDFTYTNPDQLRQWNVLPAGRRTSTLLSLLVLGGVGREQVTQLSRTYMRDLAGKPGHPVTLEYVRILHAPEERVAGSPVRRKLGLQGDGAGTLHPMPSRSPFHARSAADPDYNWSGHSMVGRVMLAYGTEVVPHDGTDGFELMPDQRIRRCANLFDKGVRLTDPVQFLEWLRWKSRYTPRGRCRPLLTRLAADLGTWFGWDRSLLQSQEPVAAFWNAAPASKRSPIVVALDILRHLLDASKRFDIHNTSPQTGVVIMDNPDGWCRTALQPDFFNLLNSWLPRIQFFVALSAKGRALFPPSVLDRCLDVPKRELQDKPPRLKRLPRGTVLLLQVDGGLPNIALMKLSRHHKAQGSKVALVRGTLHLPEADTVLASCIFNSTPSMNRVEKLTRRYGTRLQIGGSGVDVQLRLPPDIEALQPDLTLYPELGDRAMGFLTRGCPLHCPFCIVPAKEGRPRQVSDLESLLQGRNKLILLDDNILSHPSGLALLEEMARRDIAVNFNQTLDVRMLTPESATLLRRIRCSNVSFSRPNYYFSLNDTRHLDLIRERYALLKPTRSNNIEFVCMYGFNTSLAEDVELFRFLKSLPGAYVFTQRYQPVHGGPPPKLDRLFDDDAPALLEQLVKIVFTQNMKSVETYYRWLAIQYAAQCGLIHDSLIKTLFRYNRRLEMPRFMSRLNELARQAPCKAQGLDPALDLH